MALVYRRFGGSTHVRCDTFAQLKEAVLIPETQYVAVAAPVASFVVDPGFLRSLDTDDNGRIRVNELQAAVAWMAGMLKDDRGVDARQDILTVAHLADGAATLMGAAEAVLQALELTGGGVISLAQVRAADEPLRQRGDNGDGIVAPEHLPESVRALGASIMGLFPETRNRGGVAGLAPDTLQAFTVARDALLQHLATKAEVWCWGDDSLARATRIAAVADRIDEHYLLCRLVASQPDARERFRLAADRIEALVGNRVAMEAALQSLPICPPDPAGVIAFSTLHRGPSFELLSSFAREVLLPTTGQGDQLVEGNWRELLARARAILAWQKTCDDSPVNSIVDTLAGLDDAIATLGAAQQADLAKRDHLQAIADLEKLMLMQRFILDFANSFLAMPDVYTDRRALYERGWAVLAGRRYELSLLVPDIEAHKAATAEGTMCIVYARVDDKVGGSFDIALPKTRGWSTELQVGKRGIFYDLDGVEFDLVITHLVRHPVSVIEAALTPFLRIGEFIRTKLKGVDAGVGSALEKQTSSLNLHIDGATTSASSVMKGGDVQAHAPAPVPAPAPGGMGNAVAMGGLAVAAVGSSVAFIVNQLKALTVIDLISIVLLGFLAVAVPSGFVGWLKLRRRNLAEFLEGAGWALNDRLRLTPNLTARITQTPSRVPGSSLEVVSSPPAPGEQEARHTGWKFLAMVALLLVFVWQVREPLLRAGCYSGRMHAGVCAVVGVAPAPTTSPVTSPVKP
jgi:hypothetical protein